MKELDPTLLPSFDDADGAAAGTASTDTPREIGRYRVLGILGQGGCGRVYLAHDDQLNRDVAIKVPRADRLSRPEDAEQYLAEARLVASLDHPNIVPVHDAGIADGLCFVVSKFIEGSDLEKKLAHSRPAHSETAGWIAAVAEALHYAHLKGIVHRDIKPGNILIEGGTKPYVADFGLAMKEEDFGKGGGFSGTPAYMSPEQARSEGHRVDGRSDIFSLGVVFYELLVGRRPFKAELLKELLEQIASVNVEAKPPRQIDSTIPKELERICLKALAKRPQERYTTAADMADELRRFLAEHGGDTSSRTTTAAPSSKRGKSGPPKTPTLELTFRKMSPTEAPVLFPGEMVIQPQASEYSGRRDLANLVLERGVELFPRGEGPVSKLVLRADPTLDELLAAAFVQELLAGQELPPGSKAFASYAALAREGLHPGEVAPEVSLEGIFLALRNAGSGDLTDPAVGARFAADWARMAAMILAAAEAGVDPFSVSLFASTPEFAREKAFLARDQEVFRQDILRGQRWSVRIPGGPPRAAALFLRQPRSLLFKYWSRKERQAAGGEAFAFLAVTEEEGHWVFSTDPVQRLSLKPLAEALQAAEAAADPARAAEDPWFDGKPYGHTLVAAPHGGTVLSEKTVLNVVRRWVGAHSPWWRIV